MTRKRVNKRGMRVIVTCGPGYEPVDAVRRLTNFSTGELGILLTNALHHAGMEVICMKGVGATCAIPIAASMVTTFTTNDHLGAKLERVAASKVIDAIFHAAALADFRVSRITRAGDVPVEAGKLCSRDGELTLTLTPARKLITDLRSLFPRAFLVGWKYELEGTRAEALGKGRRQISEAKTDLCVVNGKAYGPGFGVLDATGALTHRKTKAQLCEYLAQICIARAREPAS